MHNCFFLFCKEHRKKVSASSPHLTNAEVTSILGKMWRELSIEKKEYYKSLSYKQQKPKGAEWSIRRNHKMNQEQSQFTFRFKLKPEQSVNETLGSLPQNGCVLPKIKLLDEDFFKDDNHVTLPSIKNLLSAFYS